MAKVNPGVVGGPGITNKVPATYERPRPLRGWSSGTTNFPSPDRGMQPVIPAKTSSIRPDASRWKITLALPSISKARDLGSESV